MILAFIGRVLCAQPCTESCTKFSYIFFMCPVGWVPVLPLLEGREHRLREVQLFVQGCTAHKGLNQGFVLGHLAPRTVPEELCSTWQLSGPRSPVQGQGIGDSSFVGLGWELSSQLQTGAPQVILVGPPPSWLARAHGNPGLLPYLRHFHYGGAVCGPLYPQGRHRVTWM